MSNEVSPAALHDVEEAAARNIALFGAPAWVDLVGAVRESHAPRAAAELAPGEYVEFLTPVVLHRHGKIWPTGVLLVTPHRLILSASRGSLRTRTETVSLYRGPESLLELGYRLLPGSKDAYWTLEMNSDDGPFLLAIAETPVAQGVAELTAAFVSRQAVQPPPSPLAPQPSFAEQPAEAPTAFVTAVPDPIADGERPDPNLHDLFATVPDAYPDVDPEPYSPPALEEVPVELAPAALAPDLDVDPDPDPDPEPDSVLPVLPPPDWYADPLGEAPLRYWDGAAWTESTAS